MVTPLRLPGVVPGIVPTVVAALDPGVVRGDGVAGGIKKDLDFFCNIWVVHRASEREVNGVSILSHVPIKEMLNLLGRGHPVRHDLHVIRVRAGFNVSQGPVVVASPQFLEGLPGFI